jgi:hypothetical protein
MQSFRDVFVKYILYYITAVVNLYYASIRIRVNSQLFVSRDLWRAVVSR